MSLLLLLLGPVVLAAQTADEGAVDSALEDWPGLADVDADDLRDLDELLRHPVRLHPDDLHRLRWIPWVTPQQLEELERHLPLVSWRAWSTLPSWSREDVERLRPFVSLPPEPSRPAALSWDTRVLALRSGRRARLRAAAAGVTVAAQGRQETLDDPAGFVSWKGRHLVLLVGDQRRRDGFGLVWASRVVSMRAGESTSPTSGWSGSTSSWRDRVLRGVGVAWERRGSGVVLLGGDWQGESLLGGVVGRRSRRMHSALSVLHRDGRTWSGMFVQRGDAAGHVAVEVVSQPGGLAAAAGIRRVRAPWTLEALILAAPRGVTSPFAAVPVRARDRAWHHLRGRVTWSGARLRLRGAWSAAVWVDDSAARPQDLELQALWRFDRLQAELSWRGDGERRRVVGVEELDDPELERQDRLLLRLQLALGARDQLRLERRSRRVLDADAEHRQGQGWRIAWRHTSPHTDVDVSVAFHEAMPGATIVFGEPAVGLAPALFHADRRGMRLAVRLRQRWRTLQVSVRWAAAFEPDLSVAPVVEAALRMTGPNRF